MGRRVSKPDWHILPSHKPLFRKKRITDHAILERRFSKSD